MTSPDLPAELKSALDAKLQGLSRNDAAPRAALISQTYRDGGGSGAIRTEIDALAYALVRMPATYAAVTASLDALRVLVPDFAPASLLDVGAGPGTATWAAAEALSSLTHFTLLIVEPGTPAGYARIIALRRQLITAAAHVAAPCPHDRECPLASPDWCHFTQRLPRSRAHKQLKSAELPYEDEKFSYVALTRAPAARHPARVIAQPVVTKVAVTARLCTDQGILNAVAARRQKAAYQRFKKIAWGDAIFDAD